MGNPGSGTKFDTAREKYRAIGWAAKFEEDELLYPVMSMLPSRS